MALSLSNRDLLGEGERSVIPNLPPNELKNVLDLSPSLSFFSLFLGFHAMSAHSGDGWGRNGGREGQNSSQPEAGMSNSIQMRKAGQAKASPKLDCERELCYVGVVTWPA